MTRFAVTDLKQFAYCPRIIYYYHCLPQIRPITYKMQAGAEAQQDETYRELRRSLKPYKLKRGERWLDVRLESEALGLRGRVDLVINTDDNELGAEELIPVDYKLSRRAKVGPHFKLQLCAYGLMLAEQQQRIVRRGFLYLIPLKRVVAVPFTTRLKADLKRALAAMHQIVDKEQMPPPVHQRGKCVNCEFRRFCNDV